MRAPLHSKAHLNFGARLSGLEPGHEVVRWCGEELSDKTVTGRKIPPLILPTTATTATTPTPPTASTVAYVDVD